MVRDSRTGQCSVFYSPGLDQLVFTCNYCCLFPFGVPQWFGFRGGNFWSSLNSIFGFLGYNVLILQAGLTEQEEFSASTTWPRSDNPRWDCQVCSALPLSSKSSSTQQLYRDTAKTQAHVLPPHQLSAPRDMRRRWHSVDFFFPFSLAKGNIILSYHLMWAQRDKNMTHVLFFCQISQSTMTLSTAVFFSSCKFGDETICLFVCLFLTKKRTISSGTVQCHNVVPPRL